MRLIMVYAGIRALFCRDRLSREDAEGMLMQDCGYTIAQAKRTVHGWEIEAGI